MADSSFDIVSKIDRQEVDNALGQTAREVATRYDFKGTHCTIEFDRAKAEIRLAADDAFRMDALVDVLQSRLIKRGVPVRNFKLGDVEPATGQSVRRTATFTQGIPADAAKRIQKAIKEGGFRKVQASIQGDELRVSSPSRDELQAVMAMLRAEDFGIELKFGNYRN